MPDADRHPERLPPACWNEAFAALPLEAPDEAQRARIVATLQARTQTFRERLEAGETLDALLPDAFATVREASNRVMGLRPFDVQLVGGMTLHRGRIAEMKTGEGKTLVATLAVYLNALSGEGVHVVTVNDYLASRRRVDASAL